MAYIGNTVQNQGFAPAVDYFNGDGTTVTFTLSRPVASVAQLTAVIENVIQNPSTAFTVSGSSITFTSAPPSGTNNIWVEYTSLITTYAALSQDPTVIGDITATGGYSATGDYGNSFVDGVILDYVTGNARITTGTSDGITLYNGGTASRSALMTINSSGNVGIGVTPSAWSGFRALQVGGSTSIWSSTSGASSSFYSNNLYFNGSNRIYINTGYATEYIQDSSAGSHIWYTAPSASAGTTVTTTERMRIDSSGRVTTPYQPAFYAYRSSPGTYSTSAPVVFDSVTNNIGSNYSTSTGRFTAPVAGYYNFSFVILAQGLSAGDVCEWGFVVNGAIIGLGGRMTYQANYTGTGGYMWSCGSISYYLNASDYMEIRNQSGANRTTNNNAWANFSGFLIG